MALELASFGEGAPSGGNLEYEQVFTDLMLVSQPGEERQVGNEIVLGQEPSPRAVAEAAEAVLARSHDLRAAVLLAWARLRTDGLAGFAEVTTWIRRCLEDYWSSCHPQLDADDDDDPTMRVNAVLGLCDSATIVRALRQAPLAKSAAFGVVTLRDIAVAEGEIEPREGEPRRDAAAIAAAFRDTPGEVLTSYARAASTALADLRAIDAVFTVRTPGRGPTLDPILRPLAKIAQRLGAETGAETGADEAAPAPAGVEPGASAGAAPAARGRAGDLSSPRDVEEALDRVIAYYRRNEPSSPVPILLDRAKRLVGADFMTIVNDMAPGGVQNVRLVGGLPEDEDGG